MLWQNVVKEKFDKETCQSVHNIVYNIQIIIIMCMCMSDLLRHKRVCYYYHQEDVHREYTIVLSCCGVLVVHICWTRK